MASLSQPTDKPATFANRLSRLVLRRQFERQFVIPLEGPPWLVEAALIWYERNVMKIDTSGIAVDRPIFMVGMPRSGTSMIEAIMCAHPHVAFFTHTMHQYRRCFCAAEVLRRRFRIDGLRERYLYDGVEVGPGTPSEGHMFLADWRKVDPLMLEHAEFDPNASTEQERAAMHETLRKVIWCFGKEARRFLNKSPNMVGYAPLIVRMLPDAKIVHIVRDGRMVANSMLKLYQRHREQEHKIRTLQGKQTGPDHEFFVPYPRLPKLAEYVRTYGADSIETTARMWRDAMDKIAEWKDELPNFYEVRYEDVLGNPQREMEMLREFCELDPVGDRQAPFWQKIGQVRPPRSYPEYGNFGRVEDICREPLRRYGYLP